LLVTHFNPHFKALTHPFTFGALQAREHTPIPSPFVVFTFGLTIESIKEFSGSIIKKILGKKSDMEL
jgi:hypothetical protein